MHQEEGKNDKWSGIIREWKASTLTQKAYCAEHDLSYSTFCYWSRAVRDRAGSEAPSSDVHAVEIRRISSEPIPFDIRTALGAELETEGIVLTVAGSEGRVTIEGKILLGSLARILAACQNEVDYAQAR
jgi:hypothetical protein